MDSSESIGRGSENLGALIRQLRLYKPVPRFKESYVKHEKIKTRAAVLVCIFEGDDGEFRVILTRRASKLSIHSGEVALPGGKAEAGDANDAATATREAEEEIGLDPSLVNVVTLFEPFLSMHFYLVTPVIGILSNKKAFSPVLNPTEVETIFDVPLEMFVKEENRRVVERYWNGGKYMMHYFDYETNGIKYVIFGLTSEILVTIASVVYQRPIAILETNSKSKITKL